VLLSRYAEPQPEFNIAHTTDSGASWAITPIRVSNLAANTVLAGDGRINFSDAEHGWINLGVVSSSNFQLGLLLQSADGGTTWNLAPSSPGVSGHIAFTSPQDGWLAGGPGGGELYVTRDGARSWQKISLDAPSQVHPATSPVYDVPVFRDGKHGFLPVTYSGAPDGSGLAVVLFATNDGGLTWKPRKTLSHLRELYAGIPIPGAIADSSFVTAESSSRSLAITKLSLTKDSARPGRITSNVNFLSSSSAIFQVSFADPSKGWILTSDGLLATTDAGASWRDITPRQAKTAYPKRSTRGVSAPEANRKLGSAAVPTSGSDIRHRQLP
jgi:photosystem II stability/assembly factor-like uncharacterized protein